MNAPIPPGAQWGFHPGGWGKPPTDEYNRPLYGDVFGTMTVEVDKKYIVEPEMQKWGDLEEEESEAESEPAGEEEQSDEEEDMDQEEDETGIETPAVTIQGLETPLEIDVPNKFDFLTSSERNEKKELYTIISQKSQNVGSFMASDHKYDIKKSVDVSINPDEIDQVDIKDLEKQYQDATKKPAVEVKSSGLGEMVDEYEKTRNAKRNRKDDNRGNSKKYKDYKF